MAPGRRGVEIQCAPLDRIVGDTLTLAETTRPGTEAHGATFIDGALMLGGGVPVDAAGSLVGAVGVSGAPSGEIDDACARAGIDAVAADLAF